MIIKIYLKLYKIIHSVMLMLKNKNVVIRQQKDVRKTNGCQTKENLCNSQNMGSIKRHLLFC